MSIGYTERIRELEAEYERLYDEIENRHGGVDYQGRLVALRKEIASIQKKAKKFNAIRKAVESQSDQEVAKAIVEVLLDDEETESIPELAADFVENELGRFDWMNNWRIIKQRDDPVMKVNAYLSYLGIRADARQIVDEIERMVREVPGRWK